MNIFHVRPNNDPLYLPPGVFAVSQPVIVWATVIVSKMASNSLLNLSLSHQTTKWCDNKRTQGGSLRGFNSRAERAIRSHRVKQRRETLKGKWYSPRQQFNMASDREALFLFQAGFWYKTEKKLKYKSGGKTKRNWYWYWTNIILQAKYTVHHTIMDNLHFTINGWI